MHPGWSAPGSSHGGFDGWPLRWQLKREKARLASPGKGEGCRAKSQRPCRIRGDHLQPLDQRDSLIQKHPEIIQWGESIRSVQTGHPIGPQHHGNPSLSQSAPRMRVTPRSRMTEESCRTWAIDHRGPHRREHSGPPLKAVRGFVGFDGIVQMSQQPGPGRLELSHQIDRMHPESKAARASLPRILPGTEGTDGSQQIEQGTLPGPEQHRLFGGLRQMCGQRKPGGGSGFIKLCSTGIRRMRREPDPKSGSIESSIPKLRINLLQGFEPVLEASPDPKQLYEGDPTHHGLGETPSRLEAKSTRNIADRHHTPLNRSSHPGIHGLIGGQFGLGTTLANIREPGLKTLIQGHWTDFCEIQMGMGIDQRREQKDVSQVLGGRLTGSKSLGRVHRDHPAGLNQDAGRRNQPLGISRGRCQQQPRSL